MPGSPLGSCPAGFGTVSHREQRISDERKRSIRAAGCRIDYNGGMEDELTNNEEGKQYTTPEEAQAAISQHQDLSGADLSGLDLSGVKLTGLNAAGINLSEADLSGAVIAAANMDQINLSGAELDGAVIAAANMAGANFRGANMRGAKVQMSNLDSADFTGADLTGTLWLAANVSGADFSETKMAGAKSSGVSWLTSKTMPADLPVPLISTPRWAPFAVLGLLGSILAFLFLRKRRKTEITVVETDL